ncbi:MAG: hypothetical protein QNJ77_01800 [Acidimicrobiia bacterium]|nr:hypothetical protein [Acidimicrobiia bacterium]
MTQWWHGSAAVIGALMLMLGIGNLVDPDDTGPLYGQLILLAVVATGAALIVYGLVLLRRNQPGGSKLVALGVLPGSVGIAFFWFPPAVAVGILALVTSWVAFRSVEELESEGASP